MKNSFGQNISICLFGESHGEAIGAVLDGLGAGIKINEAFIQNQMNLRKPFGKISTARVEEDKVYFLSGVLDNITTGTPICIKIDNNNVKSKDYSYLSEIARPGHADYTGYIKYNGFNDYRGGGHFSGRITAPLVAIGAIMIDILRQKNIYIGSHILKCGNFEDRQFNNYSEDFKIINKKKFPVLDEKVENNIISYIESAANKGDSVGGVLQTAITGIPAGLGEPWFDTVESLISHAVFSIPAVKGIEFGAGFKFANMLGSEANDSFYIDETSNVKTKTNNNGGINGGISNGMPIIFNTVIKPTPSIFQEQNTINFKQKQNTTLTIKGRHDPAIIHRARVVIDSVTAIVLCDLFVGKYGTQWFTE